MRSLLGFILKYAAKLVIWRTRPYVIAITGSVGKTSTKEAIACVLRKHMTVRATEENYNNELGVPLTILGIAPAGKNVAAWAGRMVAATMKGLLGSGPQCLVLEFAADKPGDIQYLLSVARPDIGIVTAIGEIPVHVEFFAGPKSVAKEKGLLVRALSVRGYAVLNSDDDTVLDMREETKAHIITYGFGEGAKVRATNYEIRSAEPEEYPAPSGVAFKIDWEGNIVPVRLPRTFGKPSCYAALAAVAVGIALKLPLLDMVEALAEYESAAGRMRLLGGIKRTWILDDTYNAAPASMVAALETLAALSAKRRIAVLGDMLELGKFMEPAHRSVGEQAAEVADMLITVGDRARFIADEALARGMPKQRIIQVSTADEAGKALQNLLAEGDMVLVKGSRAMHMEKVVREVMAEPERAHELLVH